MHLADNGADNPCQNQDGNGTAHRDDALPNGFRVIAGFDGADGAEDDGQYAASTAEHQGSVHIGIFKCAEQREGLRSLRTSVNHGGNSSDNQYQNRHNQCKYTAVGMACFNGFIMNFVQSGAFQTGHRADVEGEPGHDKHHNQCEDGVVIHQAHGHECAHWCVVCDVVSHQKAGQSSDNRCAPAGYRHQNAHWCGSGVKDISQFGAGNFEFVGYRAGNRTDGKAVEIVVNKGNEYQTGGQQLRTATAFDVLFCPIGKCLVAAGMRQQGSENPQKHQKEQDFGFAQGPIAVSPSQADCHVF